MSDFDAQKRLSSFRLRPTQSPLSSPSAPTFGTRPSSISPSSSNSSLKSTTSSSSSSSASSSNSSSSSRPLSHHRRKSSVSTRRESNEIMGVVTLDEDEDRSSRDEIRKRALLALEGRSSTMIPGFAKVEIPDWNTPTHEKTMDWDPPKSLPFSLTSSLAGKRDSFGRNLVAASIASKAELDTLLEEDEEEEESSFPVSPRFLPIPRTQVTGPSPPKPRPASLNLRALSLVGDLPTPVNTPSPRASSGMRKLTLSVSSTSTSSSASSSHLMSPPDHRRSLPGTPVSPGSPSVAAAARTLQRQSQLAYKRASPTDLARGLPTPLRSPSSSISSVHSERPMSPTEQLAQHAYTVQNHNSLLSRIATLESALEKSRAAAASSDELIALIADLKTERDALHSAVDECNVKYAGLEKNQDVLRKRLESERMEGWVHKDRAGQLQIQLNQVLSEKATWEKEKMVWLREKEVLEMEYEMLEERYRRLKRELVESVGQPINRTNIFSKSNDPNRHVVADSQSSSSTAVDDSPFGSISSLEGIKAGFKFKNAEPDLAIVAEEEDEDEDEELASYEDEPTGLLQEDYSYEEESDEDEVEEEDVFGQPDLDLTPTPPTAATFEPSPVVYRAPSLLPPVQLMEPITLAPSSQPPSTTHTRSASHARRASLVTAWKFPQGPNVSSHRKAKPSVDRFIVGLIDPDDDGDSSDETAVGQKSPVRLYGKSMRKEEKLPRVDIPVEVFALNFGDEEDEEFSFAGKVEPEQVEQVRKVVDAEAPMKAWTFPASAPVPAPVAKVEEIKISPVVGAPAAPRTPVRITVPTRSARPAPPPFTPTPRSTTVPAPSASYASMFTAQPAVAATTPSIVKSPPPAASKRTSIFAAPTAATNVVPFPTSSPFRMSLGSLTSFMWSPRAAAKAPAPAMRSTFEEADEEDEDNGSVVHSRLRPLVAPPLARMSPPSRKGAVDREEMKERLRERLIREGKLAPDSSRVTCSASGGSCIPGCHRCKGAVVELRPLAALPN